MRCCSARLFVVSWLLLLVMGCGRGGTPAPSASDPAQAKEALTKALDAWRSGTKISDAGLIVSDEEWSGGAQLLSYELQGEGKLYGASIRQKAMLEVRGADGKGVRKTALYQITTSPTVTVNRSDALDDEVGGPTRTRRTRE